ncbi:unnamed protein product (macronuclear) [Paramecium tetraurelia]|uniref:Uncharacterized protein n=1 Tax=Paramecium tetraurelia TaxID=5888 RepID=A0E1W2_PARTE|nr:uncharacterized protein GSPATT00022450001 [Paramecium tetraurelia]CAK89279.1 unnamed protein product [Paramecium tetraurelia]|eukprot:XP_001456676.1 hypothetical protein (macronuclear) [Paramecium tetraurelia strain d4-2]
MDDAYSHQASTPTDRDRKSNLETMRNENMNFVDPQLKRRDSGVLQKSVPNFIMAKDKRVDWIVTFWKSNHGWMRIRLSTPTPPWFWRQMMASARKRFQSNGWSIMPGIKKEQDYGEQQRYPDFIIPHFATQSGKNSNYYYAIYRILIKLREALNIKQKVELLEEKLRRFFQYWLEICSRQLDQQIINGAPIIYDKVILVFEGIDNFRELLDMHREANVNFWLPKYFPTNIKVIVTAERQSASMKLLKPDCQVIPIVSDKTVMKQTVNHHLGKHLLIQNPQNLLDIFIQLSYKVRNQPVFVRAYFSVFIPYPSEGVVEENEIDQRIVEQILQPLTLNHFKSMKIVEDLFAFQLDYFSKVNIMEIAKFRRVLLVLSLTQKGLTYPEIESVCNITIKEWKLFLVFFKVYIMKHKDLWIIHNEIFKKVVINTYYVDIKEVLELHDNIATTIDKITPNSIRKLEEQTFQLFSAKNYFSLKEVISIIENFLLLFNPSNKYDLCRYWQSLEENGFDPVLEYNKAVEGFQIHYHPSSEDMFRIIIQISRFLKEFGDFETRNTPGFRHPPIIGVLSDLYDIGLLQEILKLDLYYDKAPELKEFDPAKHLKRVAKPKTAPVLSNMESLNVEIQQNRQLIRTHYLSLLSKPIEQTENEEDQPQSLDELAEEINNRLRKVIQQKEENLSQDVMQTGERESTDYYYKRWIWIQFPWACTSIDKNCDYSTVIKQCFSSATDYMSVEDENAFTESALKIALEAKRKRKEMYEQKQEQETRLQLIPQVPVLQQKGQEEVLKKQKREQIEFSTISSSRYNRSSAVTLPPVSNRSAVITQEDVPNDNHRNNQMFITSDFTDSNYLNEESKTIKLNQSSRALNVMKQKSKMRQFSSNSLSHEVYKITEIFPIVKGNIQQHSTAQLNLLQNQAKIMRQKLNQIIYDNLQLAQTYKMLKIMDFNKGYLKKELNNLEGLKQQQQGLKLQLEQAEKQLKKSCKTKIRIKKILKVCRDNKQQNEEYIRHLNYLTRNFAKLIKFEELEIKKSQENIQQAKRQFDEFLRVYRQKREHQSTLLLQIRNSLYEKQHLDKIFQVSDLEITQKANASIEKLKKRLNKKDDDTKNKKNKEAQEKEEKLQKEKLINLEQLYQKIKGVFDIKNSDYNLKKEFIDFMAQKERKSEYEIQLSTSRQQLSEVLEINRKLNEQAKTYQSAYISLNVNQKETKPEDQTEEKKQVTNIQLQELQLKKLMVLEARLQSSLDLIAKKCGVQEQDVYYIDFIHRFLRCLG